MNASRDPPQTEQVPFRQQPARSKGERFLPEFRLRSPREFQQVFSRRCSAGDEFLLVYGYANGLPHSRLGLSVSRKVGNAVRRNRWKRLIREAFRTQLDVLPAGVDLVVVPRRDAEPTLEPLRQSLRQLASRVAKRLAKGER
jgi:ribonuclease P protein component